MYSGISGNMVDMWMLLLGGCCRQISIFVSLVVWQTGGCYRKVVTVGWLVQLCLW